MEETKSLIFIYGIIYKATNLLNGKIYIGQTIRKLQERKNSHFYDSRLESNRVFPRAIKKYGKENFKWEIIDSSSSKEELDFKEKYYILYYNSLVNVGYGYNVGEGGTFGYSIKGLSPIEKEKVNNKRKLSWRNKSKEEIKNIVELMLKTKIENNVLIKENIKRKQTWKNMSKNKVNKIQEKRLYTLNNRSEEEKNKSFLKKSLSTRGGNNPNSKKVLCEELNKKFSCMKEASLEIYGTINYANKISLSIKNKISFKNYNWKLII